MLLTITNTRPPADDLGWLLHKNPARTQSFDLAFGQAHVFYPVNENEHCTAALMLDIDPVSLVKGRSQLLSDYVTDRPYVCSSFMSVALGRVFGTAMAGRCNDRPELVETVLPLTIELSPIACRCSDERVQALFEPLGYRTEIESETESEDYRYLRISGEKRLQDALRHIEVLIPVLDNRKHQFVGEEEVEKLIRRGEGWLQTHPLREWITRRYLQRRGPLTDMAITALKSADDEDTDGRSDAEPEPAATSDTPRREKPKPLHEQRIDWAAAMLEASGRTTVADLGCGDGRLLAQLLKQPQWRTITGIDPSTKALEIAQRRLTSGPTRRQPDRLKLLQGAATYRDDRLHGTEAVAIVEVIEHLEPWGLHALEQTVFGRLKPLILILTTPNREYNQLYEALNDTRLRHRDHRFEWTREEFRAWCKRVGAEHGYDVDLHGIGPEHEDHGHPTQAAVFRRTGSAPEVTAK